MRAGDLDLLQTLVDLVIEAYPGQLAAVRVDRHRRRRTGAASGHTLKGAIANFSVPHLVDLAFELERMGAENDLAGAATVWQRLDLALAGPPGSAGEAAGKP